MRSLSRAMEVFAELQRAERPQRLSDLARTCGMSLPTTLRILRVLQDFGMVSQTDKSYRIGPAVLPAARSYLENDPLVVAARPDPAAGGLADRAHGVPVHAAWL